MPDYMVDSNVLLDVMTEDPVWFVWSSRALRECAQNGNLIINPIVCAEVCVRFERIEELDAVLAQAHLECRPIPLAAAFLAGKTFVAYKKQGGTRGTTLPDSFIGAHASVEGLTLITRDVRRYRTYFPRLSLIAPAAEAPGET
ncbi:MAG: type II toxin-antitoxin system VapC family toxin [Phycisphaerae bacterium]